MTKDNPKFPIKFPSTNRSQWISRLLSKIVHIIVIGGLLITGIISLGARDAFAKNISAFNLPSSNLGMPENRLSYTMGVGDLDGDGDFDYLARVWIDDDIDKDFKTITYAIRDDGSILWEFHHNMTYRDTGGDPTWTVILSVWDMDGDGKDEVMTQMKEGGTTKLVMLDGETGNILKSVTIPRPRRTNHATIAYLDGVNPYLVIAQGRDMVTTAYDRNLQVYWRFDDPDYYGHFAWTNIYTADVDSDGRDEIVNGALIIDDDGSVYLDGAQWDHPNEGEAERSLVGDIDPDNPGLEWYLQRAGTFNDPYRVQPNYWEGPYLIDLDQKEIIWHHNTSAQDQGWGRMHRGWVYDVDSSPGLEIFATGYFWEGNEWKNALNGVYGTPPEPDDVWVEGYSETWFLYAADGTILRTQTGRHVGYPLFWDDDDTAEYYRYRPGTLLNKFKGSTLESGFAQAFGSGESIQVDILGDWREEIIVASGYKLYVYNNNSSTAFPNRPSPRQDHTYRINMASLGTGLPKPLMRGGGSPLPPPTFTPAPTNTPTSSPIPPAFTPTNTPGITNTPLPGTFTPIPPTETPMTTPGGVVLVDSASSGTTASSSLSIAHTTSGSRRLMLVGVSINNDNFETVTSITYNGIPLTFVASETQADDARVEIWKLVNPQLGTHDVLITFSADLKRYAVAGVITFTGTDQADPLGTFVGKNATTNFASISVPSDEGDLVLGLFSCETCDSVSFSLPGVERWNLAAGAGNEIGAGATYASTGSQLTIDASLGTRDHWALGGISIKPGSAIIPTPTNTPALPNTP
ncbi:MAG: hypothetical protein IIC78_08430, partial [Chloroflexi bacterium]|nr:hypothetical protein [Chloroflexota bacterium]